MSSSQLVSPEPESRDRAPGRALVIGVVGGSGSGKTTVARALRRVNFDHPDSIGTELLVEELTRLAAGGPHVGRSVELVVEQYLTTVRPMHLEFVEPSRRHADLILPEGGQNRVAIEPLGARIARELERRRAAWAG